MEYSVNDYVIVHTNDVKQIDFIEEICGVNICYMTDKTSYAGHQIVRCALDEEIKSSFINSVKNNGNVYMEEMYDKKQFLVNSLSQWVKENMKYIK